MTNRKYDALKKNEHDLVDRVIQRYVTQWLLLKEGTLLNQADIDYLANGLEKVLCEQIKDYVIIKLGTDSDTLYEHAKKCTVNSDDGILLRRVRESWY